MLKNIIYLLTLMVVLALPTQAQYMDVQGGNQVLSITTAAAGSEPTAVVNTSSNLRYRRQTFVITKVTVSTSCPGQNFTLKVYASTIQNNGGTAAPEVTLTNGMLATDFITGIPRFSNQWRTATLRYTASATFAQGNSAELGNEVHTVTYTLVAQ
ncbi:MAG: hypothetical protein L0Y80_02160 [Ignavibacteriae bacterium]|nr:hypothetical protein [Ignavibacteriota bacterium]